MLPGVVGCLPMLKDAVCAVMMTKDGTRCSGQRIFVTSCSGMSTDAVGCSKCSDVWPDDNRYYQLQWDVCRCSRMQYVQ